MLGSHLNWRTILERVGSENNSTSLDLGFENDPDDIDMNTISERDTQIFHALLLIVGIVPAFVVVIIRFWNMHKQRQQVQKEEHHRWATAKLADPIREKYLLDLMKDYSKVSDWINTL